MMKKQEGIGMSAIGFGAAAGAGGSMAVTLILTALAANLVSREAVSADLLDALTVGILVLSAGCGSLLGYAVTGHHRLPVCLSAGLLYYLMLLGCNALVFDGAYRTVGVTAVAILGGSGAVALLGLRGGKKSPRSRYTKNKKWKVVQK